MYKTVSVYQNTGKSSRLLNTDTTAITDFSISVMSHYWYVEQKEQSPNVCWCYTALQFASI